MSEVDNNTSLLQHSREALEKARIAKNNISGQRSLSQARLEKSNFIGIESSVAADAFG
jgi:hypothetical protein